MPIRNRLFELKVLPQSVQSIMGAQEMRLSMCFIGDIFFVIVGPVKHWTDNRQEFGASLACQFRRAAGSAGATSVLG